nr:hypothetical protein [uncultured Rhodoferax sp.]
MCRNLLTLREKIKVASDTNKIKVGVMAGRRMAAIRRVLLGRSGGGMVDDLLVPGAAVARLAAELESVNGRPESERIAKAAYARGIIRTIRIIQDAESNIGVGDVGQGFPVSLLDSLNSILIPKDGGDERKVADPVIDDCISHGALGEEIRADLVTAISGGSDADEQVSSFTRSLASVYDKVAKQQTDFLTKYRSIRDDPNVTVDDVNTAYKEYMTFLDEVYTPVSSAHAQVANAALKKANNAFARVGKKIISGVMDASTVTQDDAVTWANAQEVTKQAVARLKSVGYPLDQMRADMAEFYRFTGGRLLSVKIHSKGDRRANAADIETHGKVGTINLATSFDKRVLWHELAHHLEADPVAKMAAGRYIRRRSIDGDQKYSLRSLSGQNGYRADEAAFKGNFFHPYVGKVYSDGVTEVFSMGIESFSDPETLARRAAVDPQTLEFIAGFLKSQNDPLAKAHATLREIVREMQDEATEATEESSGAYLKLLADSVELTPDTDTSWQGTGEWQLAKFKQIGRFEESGYYLLSGKVQSDTSRRMVNGLVLARLNGAWVEQTKFPGADHDVIKAMYALYRKNGIMPPYYNMNNNDYLRKNSAL